MASSNRHWPSMFKSKPCNSHNQWQHDLNSSSFILGCNRNPYTSGGVEERSPDPKPRWNPKPEQIRILEAIFNSGLVNPPRDEIRKIRIQLQEYGLVGDANVFYWFQNRKSRSKNKNRQPPKSQSNRRVTSQATTKRTQASSIMSNSSSSSDKSSSKLNNPNSYKLTNNLTGSSFGSCSSHLLDQLANYSPTLSVNQTYNPHIVQHDQHFMSTALHNLNFASTQGFTSSFPDQQQQMMMMMSNNNQLEINSNVGPCTEFMFSELINNHHGESDLKNDAEDEEKLMLMKLGFATTLASTTSPVHVNNVHVSASSVIPLPTSLQQHQGSDDSGVSSVVGPMKSTVFINDVAFEVNTVPFHVREAFGNEAVLLHSTGQPVLTNEWGMTLQPLQHGSMYYLI